MPCLSLTVENLRKMGFSFVFCEVASGLVTAPCRMRQDSGSLLCAPVLGRQTCTERVSCRFCWNQPLLLPTSGINLTGGFPPLTHPRQRHVQMDLQPPPPHAPSRAPPTSLRSASGLIEAFLSSRLAVTSSGWWIPSFQCSQSHVSTSHLHSLTNMKVEIWPRDCRTYVVL